MSEAEEEPLPRGLTLSRQRLAAGIVVAIAMAGALVVFLDWEKFSAVLARAELRPILVALLLTALSYLCVGLAFALISRMLGIGMRVRSLAGIGFVSTVLNHVMTTGGVAGYSVRYLLMNRHGVAMRDVLAASALHFYLTSLDMLTMLPVGFLYLLFNATLPAGVTAVIGIMTLVMTILAILATEMIFRENWRQRFFVRLARLGTKVLHKNYGEPLARFDQTLARGVAAMRRQPATVLQVMALTWIDWFASVAVVWLCFDALGEPIPIGSVLTGYVIGVMAGVLSMIPGGFGVQEGSMTGIFVLLGAPFEQSLLASILFRGIFFLVPYAVSLLFYGRLLRVNS